MKGMDDSVIEDKVLTLHSVILDDIVKEDVMYYQALGILDTLIGLVMTKMDNNKKDIEENCDGAWYINEAVIRAVRDVVAVKVVVYEEDNKSRIEAG